MSTYFASIYVPTLAVYKLFFPLEQALEQTKKAWSTVIRIACGGDTGAFAYAYNARDMELMPDAGVSIEDVLTNSSLHEWEACGRKKCERRFGCLNEGVAADIFALDADPRVDPDPLRKISFVMKDTKV